MTLSGLPFITRFYALPYPARIAALLLFLASCADGALMPFFALWAQQEAGVPTECIGLLLGCYAGGELLATPLLGGIADRLGRRPVLLMATTGVGLGFLALYFSSGILATALILILIGGFESVMHPTAATVVADNLPANDLRGGFALVRSLSNLGRLVGPAIGALLAGQALGLVFLGSAGAMLIGAAAAFLLLPETRPANASSEDEEDDFAALSSAFRDRRLAALLLPVAVIEIASSWIEALLPLQASDVGILSPSGIGLLFTYAGALSVLFQMMVLKATERLAGFTLVLASGALLTLAYGSLLLFPGLIALIAAVTLLAFAEMLTGPLVQSLVGVLAPSHARATYMAALSTVHDLEDTAGPAIGTYLYALGSGLPWLIALPVTIAGTIALAYTARRWQN